MSSINLTETSNFLSKVWSVAKPYWRSEERARAWALLTAVVVAACFPILMMRRGNVTIRMLGQALGSRTARLFDLFGALVSALFFALMTWQYTRFSAEMASANESSPILRWPSAPWWWAVTALIAVATLAALWRCLIAGSQEKQEQ